MVNRTIGEKREEIFKNDVSKYLVANEKYHV